MTDSSRLHQFALCAAYNRKRLNLGYRCCYCCHFSLLFFLFCFHLLLNFFVRTSSNNLPFLLHCRNSTASVTNIFRQQTVTTSYKHEGTSLVNFFVIHFLTALKSNNWSSTNYATAALLALSVC